MGILAFEVRCDRTHWGEVVGVLGSTSSLGAWNPEKAVALDTTRETWPVWSLSMQVDEEIEEVGNLEYKYVVLGADREIRKWESSGANRKYQDRKQVEVFGKVEGMADMGQEWEEHKSKARRHPAEDVREILPELKDKQRIGKGKQAGCQVGVAEDGTRIVVKQFKAGGRRALAIEGEALRRLTDTDADTPALVGLSMKDRMVMMSFFEGKSSLEIGRVRDLVTFSKIVVRVCKTLSIAHEHKVIHCDVNPGNLLVSGCDICLVDWACSRILDYSTKGIRFGKLGYYQPPEIMDGDFGPYTDVFGAAGTFLWILANASPNRFRGLPQEEVKERIYELLIEQSLSIHGPASSDQLQELATAIASGLATKSDRCDMVDLSDAFRRVVVANDKNAE